MGDLARYTALVLATKAEYERDFAALEAKWVAERQAVIDRVEREVGFELEGLVDFLSRPVDARHDAARDRLFANFVKRARSIREECGL